jgi:hypothetical protein
MMLYPSPSGQESSHSNGLIQYVLVEKMSSLSFIAEKGVSNGNQSGAILILQVIKA